MKEEYLNLLKDLIQCRPVTSQVQCVNKVTHLLKEFLEKKGLYCNIENLGERDVLYVSTRPGKVQDLLLNAHVDVVPAVCEEDYHPRVEGDRLYGRGANDCLGNVVTICQFLCEAGKSVSAAAFFSADEEDGGCTTEGMVQRGYSARKAVLVVDSGGYSTIGYAQKGIIVLKLKAKTHGGHASVPWRFENPIERLIEGYCKLRAAWQNPTEENPWSKSMTPCVITGGTVNNQIPDEAWMEVNIRYVADEELNEIVKMAKDLSGLEVTVENSCPPVSADPEQPAIKLLSKAFEKVDPSRSVQLVRLCGATDARYLKNLGVPVGIIGAVGGGIHGKGEYLEMPSVDILVEVMKHYASSL